MKKLLIVLAALMFVVNNSDASVYAIVNNNAGAGTAEDSLTVIFTATDSISNIGSPDSFYVCIWSPTGDSVFSGAYIKTATEIDSSALGARPVFRWTKGIADIDGASPRIGTYVGCIIAIDTLDGTSSDYLDRAEFFSFTLEPTLAERTVIGMDWSGITNPTATVNLSNTTISTGQNVNNTVTVGSLAPPSNWNNMGITAGGYVSLNIGSVTGTYAAANFSGQTSFWNEGKTGYTLVTQDWTTDSDLPSNFAAMLITAGGYSSINIGDVTGVYAATDFSGQTSYWNEGKTGYTLVQAFPSNFAAMLITAGGYSSINIGDVTGVYAATDFSGQTSYWNEGKTGYGLTVAERQAIADVVNDSVFRALIDGYDDVSASFGEKFGALPDTNSILTTDSLINLLNNGLQMLGSVADCTDSLKQVLWPLDSTSPKDSIVVWCKASDTDSTRLFKKAYKEGTGNKVDYISIQ